MCIKIVKDEETIVEYCPSCNISKEHSHYTEYEGEDVMRTYVVCDYCGQEGDVWTIDGYEDRLRGN